MTDSAKVVGMDGNPAVINDQTAEDVIQMMEHVQQILRGQKHVAIGIVLIDDQGRPATNFWWQGGGFAGVFGLMAGVALLETRIIREYEKQQEEGR